MLTSEQLAAIERVRELSGCDTEYTRHDFNVHRWITAYGGDEAEAAKVLARHVNIRSVMRLTQLPEEGDGVCPLVDTHAPLSVLGRNKKDDNKVLVIELSGRADIYGLVDNLRVTPFMRAKFRAMERIQRRVEEEERRTGRQSGGLLVMDLHGLSFQPSLLSVLAGPYRIMWGTLFEQYPQLIQQIVIVNAPKFVNLLYQTCIPFIPSDYKEKIVISSEARETLLKYIDEDCLPPELGGSRIPTETTADDFELCSEPLQIPKSPFPAAEPIEIDMDTISIPAGSCLVRKYYFEADTPLEFHMQHDSEFTLFLYHCEHDTPEDSLWREIYAGCERPAVQTVDKWRWTAPLRGYYYLRFGNEKAWFLSVAVQYKIHHIKGDGKEDVKHIE